MQNLFIKHLFIFVSVAFSTVSCSNSTDLGPGTPSADGPEFLSWELMADKDTVDSYIRKDSLIYCGDSEHPWAFIEEADTSSFEVWPDSYYARDASNVYYPIETTCLPDGPVNVCFCKEYIVEGAVPENFRYLGKGYGTDGFEVYYQGVIHQGSGGQDF